MFVSPQRVARIQPPLKALDWAPHPISLPDMALQLAMALASAWPDEGSVADPHAPSGAMVTTLQSSWSGTMASVGVPRLTTITAHTCNCFMFRLQRSAPQSVGGCPD